MSERDGTFDRSDLESIDLGDLDPERYDFDELRADIDTILDLGTAARSVLKWAILVPLISGFIAWLVFRNRMGGVALFFFLVVLLGIVAIAATSIGLILVLRRRIEKTNAAADRVVSTTSMLHADVLRIRSGEADLPMREVAHMLTSELVFPALNSGGESLVSGATGPFAFVGRRLLKGPMRMIEARVLDALDEPDTPASESTAVGVTTQSGVADDTTEDSTDDEQQFTASDLVDGSLAPDLPAEFSDWYRGVHDGLTRVVDGVGTVAVGSLGAILVMSFVPLIGWLAFGWFVF